MDCLFVAEGAFDFDEPYHPLFVQRDDIDLAETVVDITLKDAQPLAPQKLTAALFGDIALRAAHPLLQIVGFEYLDFDRFELRRFDQFVALVPKEEVDPTAGMVEGRKKGPFFDR